jgi:transposase-like protein
MPSTVHPVTRQLVDPKKWGQIKRALLHQPGPTQESTPTGAVAREMGLTETAVREWVKQAERDDGTRTDGLSSAERTEMAQLRKELREAREERDILKRAVAFFAREIR